MRKPFMLISVLPITVHISHDTDTGSNRIDGIPEKYVFKNKVLRSICFVLFLLSIGLNSAFAQVRNAAGLVVDENGQPLIGVQIKLEGTTTGVITDVDGNFLLQEVPLSVKKVVVTSIGMETREVDLNVPVQLTGKRKKVSFVAHAGLSMSKYTIYGSDFKVGYEFGLGIEVRMSKRWAFQPTLQICNHGAEFNAERYGVKYQETWNPVSLDLPMLFILRCPIARKMNLAFSMGPVFSYGFAGKVKASETGKPDEEYDIYSSEYEYDYSGGKHSLLHPFSFGVAYGIGVEYKKWLAGISGKSMCLGQDDEGFEAKEHNLVLTLGVTYRF